MPCLSSLQFFSRVFPATRFAFVDDLKQVLSDVSPAGVPAAVLRGDSATDGGKLWLQLRGAAPNRPCPPQLKWYLLFLVAVMAGFATAFSVLFGPDAATGRGKPVSLRAGRPHAEV